MVAHNETHVSASLLQAQADGVLTTQEAFELEALAESDDGRVPEHLLDAVERLYLWCLDSPPIQ